MRLDVYQSDATEIPQWYELRKAHSGKHIHLINACISKYIFKEDNWFKLNGEYSSIIQVFRLTTDGINFVYL